MALLEKILKDISLARVNAVECRNLKNAPDNCVMLHDPRVVLVENFVQNADQKYIIGREFRTQQDYFLRPVPSSVLSEFCVSNLSPLLQAWKVEHIKH